MSFTLFNLDARLLKATAEAGYTEATPIQAEAIPHALDGQDLMASASTGTGKTAAFVLPALQRLTLPSPLSGRGPRVLILAPTRELAAQVKAATETYGRFLPRLRVVSVLGGTSYTVQNKLLSQPVDVIVATPGRLIDQMQRGRIDFSRIELVVLDEADRMLDMGFLEAVESIVAATPASRQTLMFSATFDGAVARLAQRLLKSPRRIAMASRGAHDEQIEQRLHYVDNLAHKNQLLMHLLEDHDIRQALVFTGTKRDADDLSEAISQRGHRTAALHGDMQQRQRNSAVNDLRRGAVRVMVATDVAARGIDVAGISHVINYDLPRSPEDYVHRIGRTGRAGASGIAVSLVKPEEGFLLKRIERFTGQAIVAHVIAGMEPRRKPTSERARSRTTGGRSKGGYRGRPGSESSSRGDSRPGRDDAWGNRVKSLRTEINGNSTRYPSGLSSDSEGSSGGGRSPSGETPASFPSATGRRGKRPT